MQNGQLTLFGFENFLRTHEASIDSFISKESRIQKNMIKRVDVDWEQFDIYAEDLYDHPVDACLKNNFLEKLKRSEKDT